MARRSDQQTSDEQKILFIASALAVGASNEETAKQLAKPLELSVLAISLALLLSTSKPVPNATITPGSGESAKAIAANVEGFYRAAYILNAARRLDRGLARGLSRVALLEKERTFFQEHLDATQRRATAAIAVDRAASRYGPELGWYARLDSRTTPECRAAHGKNFNALQRPAIGYPGSVHRFCRCKAGKPFATKQTVYGIVADRRVA